MINKIMQQNIIKISVILIIVGLILTIFSFAITGFDFSQFKIEEPRPWYRTTQLF